MNRVVSTSSSLVLTTTSPAFEISIDSRQPSINKTMASYELTINSPNVRYSEEYIESDYVYESVKCVKDDQQKTITVSRSMIDFDPVV